MTSLAPPRWFPSVGWRRVLTFAVLVVVLLGPWPGYGRVFAVLFSTYGNGVVRGLAIGDSRASPHFAPPTPGQRRDPEVGEWAVMLSVEGAGRDDGALHLDTRILGYTPLAIFLALTLASPIGPRRKVMVLVAGLAFLLARLAVAIALPVARALGPSRPGWASGPLAEVVWWVLIEPPVMSYATPLLAWWVALALGMTLEANPQAPARRPRRSFVGDGARGRARRQEAAPRRRTGAPRR